jgi:hypothetical protein
MGIKKPFKKVVYLPTFIEFEKTLSFEPYCFYPFSHQFLVGIIVIL